MRQDSKRKEIIATEYEGRPHFRRFISKALEKTEYGNKWKMGPVLVFCVFLISKAEFRIYLHVEMLIANLYYRFAT